MKKIVVLTGAGMSADSGLQTFRDKGGLWDKYDPMELATPEAWNTQAEKVLEFYNIRRKFVREAYPNDGHKALVELEKKFDLTIVTQNVDDLHERAGSSDILHLHGEIKKARSTTDESLIYDLDEKDIFIGDKCEKASQLRPHIVWFGEAVPMLQTAIQITATADIFIIIGTGLSVYPAASLINYAPKGVKMYVVDKNIPFIAKDKNITAIEKKASEGVPELVKELMKTS